MPTENAQTASASELADEAKRTAREALIAAQGYAQESGRIGRDGVQSIRSSVEDARTTGSEALDTVEGLSRDAADIAKDAAITGRTYAQNAVSATGKKLRDWKGQVNHAKESCERYVADEPVRSSLIAVAGGAVLMTVLLSFMKRRTHYET
jgi:ElaB/YqjD/DUF883 family membrane-anchored ribosome-binding protein